MALLLSISSPFSAERQLDVVFVHGLGGDPIETWRSGPDENTSWPHWLALEFGAQIGVWSLGYAAAPSKWEGVRVPFFGAKDPDAGAAMTLPRRAENALDRLVVAGIGQRPVCFITHSLGGLLVKSILRRAADSVNAPERLQVVQQCRGVLFLATPHHGSRLADMAGDIKVYLPSVSTLDLKDNDDHLMDLYEWYRGYAPSHHILTRSYYENKQTNGVVVVVPRSSADPGVTGETARGPTPLDKDHLEISKPRTRLDQAYIGSTLLIRLILSDEAISASALPESSPLSVCKNFSSGLSEILSNRETLETVDIMAYTSTSYFKAIEDSNIRIRKLRVLIRDPATVDGMQFPSDPLARQQFISEIDQRVCQWKAFRDEGKIEDIQIRYYSFDSLIYFFMANDLLLHFGFLIPREKYGPKVTAPMTRIGPDILGEHLFKCSSEVFTAVWNNFSR